MPECDHSAMKTTGEDFATACAGCGEVIGKFTAPDGRVFTTLRAFNARGA